VNAPAPDWQPTLRGALVALRPLAWGDFDVLYAVASDPLVWAQHPAHDRHELPVFRAFFEEAMAGRGALFVSEVTTGEVIGSSRYHGYDAAADEVEVGWTFLARRCWGGAYNGELKRLMLGHAFRYVGRVVMVVGPGNVRSQRAVERIGGRRVGERRGHWLYEVRRGETGARQDGFGGGAASP
jgi:RimJ/RimL family protein N-acetyltransferase